MSLAVHYTPEPLLSRRAHKRHMSRTAKAFSAISLGAAFALTAGEAFAQSSRTSAEDGFSPLQGQPLGFNDAGDLRVLLASGEEITIPRGAYGMIGDQIMVSDMIDGVEVAQNGYIPPTSEAYPVYGNAGGGPFGNLGMGTVLIPLGLILGGILAYYLIQRANNDAPAFEETAYSASFEEDATGTVDTVKAVDGEGDTITYSLSGTDAEFFSIDSSGKITFTDEPNFDAPGDEGRNNIYTFNAVATDEHDKASSVPVTITVTSEPDSDTAATASQNGTSANDDFAMAAAVVSTDLGGGNDSLDMNGGIASGGSVDMGAGNDYAKLAGAAAGAASIDLGLGNDELELDVDATAILTIDMAGGNDILDLDANQGAVHVVQNFGAGDLIDAKDLSNLSTFDATAHASLAAATTALGTSDVAYYTSGSNVIVVFDTSANGAVDFSMQINDISALTSTMFDL